MSAVTREHVTTLVVAARHGDQSAKDNLFALVYDELRDIAHRSPMVPREGATLQATALANEAYIQFVRRIPPPPEDEPDSRATFFRTVALAMRTILRDYYHKKMKAQKRGGEEKPIALGDFDPAARSNSFDGVDFLTLDDALTGLERYNARWFDVVMHKYFAGRSNEETAELMGVGVTTVKKDWKLAKAWLQREVEGGDDT